MKQYKLVNNISGWLVFLVAAITYCLTVEPTASFWDCPEFITTGYKLEVGHPPGAPFFMLTANFFTQFTNDPANVAYCVNIMSALLSAFCILFLFWSITHLTRKLVCPGGQVQSLGQMVTVIAAGVTGALAYTWSDTFWFSAVEGEVYAYSSMFTALVFWLILKWEEHADEPHSDRYLVLIFYLTGLSIGVHLLNLLCLPAIVLVYYYHKKPQANAKGSLAALGVAMLLIVAVLYGVVPGIVKVGGWFELFFVNVLGLGFNTGLIIYILLLIAVVLTAIWATTTTRRTLANVLYVLSVTLLGIPFFMGHGLMAIIVGILIIGGLSALMFYKKDGQHIVRKRLMNTSLLCMLMLMIGYSSYAVIVVRSTSNTPMDQNSPEDIFTLGTYLGREQYGETPLLYGQAFSSKPCYQKAYEENPVTGEKVPLLDYDAQGNAYYRYEVMSASSTQTQRHEKADPNEPDRYDILPVRGSTLYPSGMKMLFPRMYASAHTASYQSWLGDDLDMNDVDASWNTPMGEESTSGEMPSFMSNLRFFMSYQINFMYWRYFMWNFAGRQNDMQTHGQLDKGNWITGFPFIDNLLYGDQSELPDDVRDNAGRNVFFCLPLLLGLLGLFWQAFKGREGIQQFWVVFFLFFMTGLAIVLYLNQTPSQPRERDYAYAGSFYAFAIWIGMGVAALAQWLTALARKMRMPEKAAIGLASVIGLIVPLQMVSQTWDDHDRSGRYACRDFGMNYLNSMEEKHMPIIFTNGDNDTFPLWYAQETEGQRTDARVCNLSYLQTDWYTDQMRRPAYESESLPIAWNRYEYVDNRGKGFDYYEIDTSLRHELDEEKARTGVNTYELSWIIDHYIRGRVANDQPGVWPTDSAVVRVNRDNVLAQGITVPAGQEIPEYITISFRGRDHITKSQMMVYEMVGRNNWERPIYMSVTLGTPSNSNGNYAGLQDYLVLEGLAYRLTPFFSPGASAVDSEKMYHNMMDRFRYGNVNDPGVYLDETVRRMAATHRNMFTILAQQLLNEGKTAKALKVLERCKKEIPDCNTPYDQYDIQLARLWLRAGKKAEAARVAEIIGNRALQYLKWASSLREGQMSHTLSDCHKQVSTVYNAADILTEADSAKAQAFEMKVKAVETLPVINMLYNYLQMQHMQQSGGLGAGLGDYGEDYDE